jgi:hypothetical protein
MYIIEDVAINEFLEELPRMTQQRLKMNLNELSPTEAAQRGLNPDFFGATWNKAIAKDNIIKRLIPLCCLLNQGFDIENSMKYYTKGCLEVTGAIKNNIEDKYYRTYSNLLTSNPLCTIENRIRQNCARLKAYGSVTLHAGQGTIPDLAEGRGDSALVGNLLQSLYGASATDGYASVHNGSFQDDLLRDKLYGLGIIPEVEEPQVSSSFNMVDNEKEKEEEEEETSCTGEKEERVARSFLEGIRASVGSALVSSSNWIQSTRLFRCGKGRVLKYPHPTNLGTDSTSSTDDDSDEVLGGGRIKKKTKKKKTKRKKRKKKKTKRQRKNKKKTKRRRKKRKKTRRRR